jgi:hypothetical protein
VLKGFLLMDAESLMKQRCSIQNKRSLKFGTRVSKFGTSALKG